MIKTIKDGVYPTMLTPFTEDKKIDYDAVLRLLQWYKDMGVDGIFAICQSSEIFYLSFEERLELLKFIMANLPEGMDVVASGHTADDLDRQIYEANAFIETGIDAYVFIANRFVKEDEDDDIVREKIEDAQGIADALLNSPRYDFSNLVPSKLENGLAVVYAIFDKQDDSTLYVGRTKNLRQRLYNNHLMGPKSNARLKKYLTEDPERPDIPTLEAAKQYLIDNCYFQYIPEPDIRQRGQIEGLLGYLLNVRYIHEEH